MILTKEKIVKTLEEIGVVKGDLIIVHTSLSSFGRVVSGGAQTIIESLLEAIGSEGTIVMPTQSWKNLDPETGVHGEVSKEDAEVIRQTWPAYNKNITPTNTMGSVAEMFRLYPGSHRSDHPARSFAANGKLAEYIISNHDLSDIFGATSPLNKLYNKQAKILLIGVDYDKNTSIHLADELADYPSKHTETHFSSILENGKRVWKKYETLYVDGEDFGKIGEEFEIKYPVNSMKLGESTLRLMSQRNLVDFSVEWIEANRG
ncbi:MULTISPECIES: AAC(3) family N-acetyltransferase [Vagococcus]|uniref:Aminoglycoside N(3)-acetyltransferase n=1 Tax=Vagococcus fluvialis bH819 TaxID=1255619 RepID=A0A1X6WPB5_9ENTE|nr:MULTISPECIES: AAC(3) family N-acetyltransferase [Vagococcus]SLM86154.1 aminoglycoside N3-acetyltransferase [Vagococcus fluvialis bH819]